MNNGNKSDLLRKEVWLRRDELSLLQEKADKRGWYLKKYMEHILSKEAKPKSSKQKQQ